MKIKCMIDKQKFNKKPTGYETAGIQKRLAQTEVSVDELSKLLSSGCTFKPALLNGTKSDDWISQQIFALDFDGNTTIQSELDRCVELNILPIFGYTSFSHTEEKHKFRLVFALDEPITDRYIRNKLQITLIKIFSNSDQVTFDPARIFYGGKKLIYDNMNDRINVSDIIDNYYKDEFINTIPLSKSKEKTAETLVAKGVECGGNLMGEYITGIDFDNTNNIFPHQVQSPETPCVIKLIRDRNEEKLREKLNYPKRIFETEMEFLDFIRKEIDLGELLELKYPSSFKCLLHVDSDNSAGIFKNEDGVYLYKCFSSNCRHGNRALNIITLIESLTNFRSRHKTYEFIKSIFNIELCETEFQKEQIKNIANIQKALYTSEFNANCPVANNNTRHVQRLFLTLLTLASQHIYDEDYTDREGNIIFFASLNHIGKEMNLNKIDAEKISQRLSVLIYHKLIIKLDDIDIPEKLLKKSQGYAIHSNYEKRVNWYAIPSFVIEHYADIEIQGRKWKTFGYTIIGSSREMFYRAEGKAIADYIYPQHKYTIDKSTGEIMDRTTSKSSDEKTNIIVKNILKLIDKKGYVLEKQVTSLLMKEYGCCEDTAKRQFKKSQAEIIEKYNLKKTQTTKILKEQYNIKSKGYPYIYVKNNT